ncbi:MAG: PspC domain-containing protein [Opitutales bacterium]
MKLKKSHDKVIAGVCGGIAEALELSPSRLRVVYTLVTILSAAFPGILIYLALWYLLPPADGA